MLHRLVPLVLVASTLPVAWPVGSTLAQESIRPARAIRVVETVDRRTGRTARDVVPDPLPAEVLRVQVELARAGHDPGLRSGVLDEPTRRALRGFQIVEALTICGCLTVETVRALGIRTTAVGRAEIRRATRAGARVLVVVPDARRPPRDRTRRPAVDANPGVSVGHAPVGGRRARPSRPRPERPRIDLPNPPRGRSSGFRAAPGGSAGERDARPRP